MWIRHKQVLSWLGSHSNVCNDTRRAVNNKSAPRLGSLPFCLHFNSKTTSTFFKQFDGQYFRCLWLSTVTRMKLFLTKDELLHEKKNDMCPAKTQIQPGIHPIWSEHSQCTQKVVKGPVSSCRQRRLWSEWADLSLHWHTSCHFVGLVKRWLNCLNTLKQNLKS